MFKKIIKFLIVICLAAFLWLWFSLSSPAGSSGAEVVFTVTAGESFSVIAAKLKEQKLIKNETAFKLYAKINGWDTKAIPGQHLLRANMSAIKIAKELAAEDNLSNEIKITIIEGWRLAEMAGYLEQKLGLPSADFLAAAQTAKWREQYDFLSDVSAKTLEGFLFPDTYRVFKDAAADDIIEKMLDNFYNKLSADWRQEIKNQNKSIFEIIILASIVEKEAATPEDQAMVADVFWKRLSANIGLQSDATVNYISGKSELRPSAGDLQLDSPYNTYKHRGLPPGPIANPGLSAIKAVIYPTANDYYYFLMDKDGQTHYAKTFAEHQANIQKYLD